GLPRGLSRLVTDILNGVFEGRIRDLLLSGVLIAAKKSSGAPRPVVMGETFYKLAGLFALSQVRSSLSAIVEPIQLAFSRGGAESAVQIIQAALDMDQDNIAVTVDIE